MGFETLKALCVLFGSLCQMKISIKLVSLNFHPLQEVVEKTFKGHAPHRTKNGYNPNFFGKMSKEIYFLFILGHGKNTFDLYHVFPTKQKHVISFNLQR